MTRDWVMDRRRVLLAVSGAALAAAAGPALAAADPYAGSSWRKLTDAEWKKRLPQPAQAKVPLRCSFNSGLDQGGSVPSWRRMLKTGCGRRFFHSASVSLRQDEPA